MSDSKLCSIFFLFFLITTFASSSTSFNNIHKCPKKQSEALLLFKHSLFSINDTFFDSVCYDSHPIMMSWNTSTDCCNWNGITCDYSTGDVIGLDVSCGMLSGTIHPNSSLFNLPHLQKLNLAFNWFIEQLPREIGRLNGTLPSWLFTSPSLEYLSLSYNMFSGKVPFESFSLPSLQVLDLRYNQLAGQIDVQTFQQLTNLTYVDLSFNNFSGEWELDTLLSSLTNLEKLDLSYNGFSVTTKNANHYVNPGFRELHLASCKLKVFPSSFRAMRQLERLDLSSNEIHGQIPHWVGEIGGNELIYLNLSHNFITGLPQVQWYGLEYLYVQSNLIQGPFPPSICNMSKLVYLVMSNNRFDGLIPQCFGNITSSLGTIDMGNNSFQGTIPNIYGDCEYLEGLSLNGNQLRGEVPISLSKCRFLNVLDLGNNHLTGTFPGWLGDLPNLQALVLKSNNFHGHIQPSSTVEFPFPSLRVLDLSHNGFVGQLPAKYFQNFNSMKNVVKKSTTPEYLSMGIKYYSFVVAVKGVNQEFPQISVDYTIIDLSDNTFKGEILDVIGGLNSLIVLNLSHNCLKGPIPHALGNLIEIESLDLSWNQLSGEIPQSLARITTLEVLNLSQNHLVGRIPEGPQFSTFGTSFGGNSGLYGSPLPKREHQSSSQVEDDGEYDDEEESGFTWKVVTLGYGCGTLLVMGYLMLSTRKVKWFNAIADATESFVLKKKKRRHVYIGK
ncbi:Leucine-rich repeat-containing protein [Artemisia annua]|uniref:Leucine-rich repeat-containing protein n=1 Tax=Artemisia annua TaxID=35608 RepID=A0A2U1QG75_ARTAN|nr:Leucine-rich repeat-containing protein [Artemisia annua]